MQIRQLSSALRKKAEEELNETPSTITASLKILRDWLKQQPHLHSVNPCSIPEFFGNRDPFDENIQEILKLGVFLPLKKSMPEDSPRACLSRVGPYCTHSQRSLTDFVKVSLMILEILLLEDDNVTISGEDVIVDLNGLGLSMIWQWTPAFAKKTTSCSEKALSVRLKSLHLLNAPYGLGGALAIFKMFLGAKIRNRIFSHSKDTLHDKIDKSILPEEYGGTDGTVQELIDYWKAKMESHREWFLDETAYSDESKRPKAEKEVNEHPKRLAEDLCSFKEWLRKQPHLHLVQPTDQWLLAFLRGGKFSLERSKEKLDMYYTMKGIVPEFFANRDPMDPKIQEILKLGIFLPLRKCAKEDSSRACFMRLGIFDSTKYHLTDLIKEVVVDMKDVGVNMLSQWTPALAKKTITCFEKAMPIRVRGNHFLNTPPVLHWCLGWGMQNNADRIRESTKSSPKPRRFSTALLYEEAGVLSVRQLFIHQAALKVLYLRPQLDERKRRQTPSLILPKIRSVFARRHSRYINGHIQVHNKNYKGLYKTVPKPIITVEYGGEDGTMQDLIDHWKAKVESYRDWFVQQERTTSDESKRADNIPKNSAIVFGVEGSFRKLEVD
ncbi:Uncharacterized protein OBRU01_10660 [Operophtera brumata]|uniref:CRAL-TRIO domain-containing protein n=1 Tax=Operophtera brumata TaxID=104452 RepID=A0A0L7LDL8_OPEBR|nr:Uncharacterized protein OBRU01_10660 [Operophtera brumata]